MKKFYSFVAVVLVLILTAMPVFADEAAQAETTAAPEQDAFELLETALAEFNQAKSYELDGDITMSMKVNDETIDITMGLNIKQVINKDGTIDMAMTMSAEELGVENIVVYYRNGYYYYEMGKEKYKVRMPVEQMVEESLNLEFGISDEDLISEATVEEIKNGTALRFKIKGEDMGKMFDAIMDNDMFSTLGLGELEYQFEDIVYTVILNNRGKLYSQKYKFGFNMTMEEETVGVEMAMNLRYVSTNKIAKIMFPENLNAYPTLEI